MTAASMAPSLEPGAPAVAPRLIEFFQREAREVLHRMQRLLDAAAKENEAVDAGKLMSAARTLRGSAAMARLTDLSLLAGRLERVARSLHAGRLEWSATLAKAVGGALPDLKEMIETAGQWSPELETRARARDAELAAFASSAARSAPADRVVPVASLFHDDAGPHVMYMAFTPQTQFEQHLRDRAAGGAPGAIRQTPPQARTVPPVTPAEERRRTPTAPRGQELRALLEASVSQLTGEHRIPVEPLAPGSAELVPIDSLLYRGSAALERARALGSAIRSAGATPLPDELAELMDLIELARTD